MLTVTATAKEKLEEALQLNTSETDEMFRISVSDSNPKKLELGFDKEREGDQVVESETGIKVLVIGPKLATKLDGVVFDYHETSQGAAFTVSKTGK